MSKSIYEKPQSEIYVIDLGGTLLQGSVEAMNTVNGSWDEDE